MVQGEQHFPERAWVLDRVSPSLGPADLWVQSGFCIITETAFIGW